MSLGSAGKWVGVCRGIQSEKGSFAGVHFHGEEVEAGCTLMHTIQKRADGVAQEKTAPEESPLAGRGQNHCTAWEWSTSRMAASAPRDSANTTSTLRGLTSS